MTAQPDCFYPGCDDPSIPANKFCGKHLRAAERWMGDEARLDKRDEARAKALGTTAGGVMNGWDDRPSVRDEIKQIGWDDPDELALDEYATVVDPATE